MEGPYEAAYRASIQRPDEFWGAAAEASCRGLEELPMKPGSPTKPVPGSSTAATIDDAAVIEELRDVLAAPR